MSKGVVTLHLGEDLSVLAEGLAPLVANAPGTILDRPWCVAPSLSVSSWLMDALAVASGTEGIAANLETMSPSRFVALLESACLEDQQGSWSQGALAVKIHGLGRGDSMKAALRQSTELTQLLEWRPELFTPTRITELPGDLGEIASAIGLLESGPLHRRQRLFEAISSPDAEADLPRALYVFGLSYIPGGRRFLDLLGVLSKKVELHLFLAVPSIEIAATCLGSPEDARLVLDDPTRFSWLDESLEAMHLLSDWASSSDVAVSLVRHESSSSTESNVLSRLKQRVTGEAEVLGPDDGSVSLIGSYGRSRQVEELRDVLIEKLETNPDLQPHEIAVLCPDLEAYLPLLQRHWLNPAQSKLPNLPFHAAQRAHGQSRRRVDVSLSFLSLIGSHVTADQMGDFLGYSSVATTLGLTPEAQFALLERATEGRLLFGASATQRARFGIYGSADAESSIPVDVGTWRRVTDRVVAAALYPDARNVDESDVALAHPPLQPLGETDDLRSFGAIQPLLEILDATATYRSPPEYLATPPPLVEKKIDEWLEELEGWMHTVARRNGRDESFENLVEEVRLWAGEIEGEPLSFDEFVELWRSLVTSSPSPSRFNLGGVVVTDAGGLPYAPFKVVALLGLDEANFPAGAVTSTLLLSEHRRPGDPDPRRGLRGGLLAGVLSATKSLVVVWSTRDEIKGQEVLPCIVLAELLGEVAQATSAYEDSPELHGSGDTLAKFVDGKAHRHHFFGDHPETRFGASLARGESRDWAVAETGGDRHVVTTTELAAFLRAPVATYLRQVRNLEIPEQADELVVIPPVEHSALDLSRFGERVVEVMLSNPLREEILSLPAESSMEVYQEFVSTWKVAARRVINDVAKEEEFSAVPPQLWLEQSLRGRLENFTLNMAWDLTELEPIAEEEIQGKILEFDSCELLVQLGRETATSIRKYYRSRDQFSGRDVVSAINLRPKKSPAKQSNVDSTVFKDLSTLFLLKVLFPEADAAVDSVFLPANDAPTARANGFLPGHAMTQNARVQLCLDEEITSVEAALRLGRLLERYRAFLLEPEPPVLFRTTSASQAFSVLGKPKLKWESGFVKQGAKDLSESAQPVHRLTFPVPFETLEEKPGFRENAAFFAELGEGVRLRWSPSANAPTPRILQHSFVEFSKRFREHSEKPTKSNKWINSVPLTGGAEREGDE